MQAWRTRGFSRRRQACSWSVLLDWHWHNSLPCNLLPSLAVGTDHPVSGHKAELFTSAWYRSSAPDAERSGKRSYVDRIRVQVQAGNGGSGCVAFWKSAAKGQPSTGRNTGQAANFFQLRSHTNLTHLLLCTGKFQPPDGGNGGHGGSVVVQACAA